MYKTDAQIVAELTTNLLVARENNGLSMSTEAVNYYYNTAKAVMNMAQRDFPRKSPEPVVATKRDNPLASI